MPELKGRKERFCQEYTVLYNQTKAALAAGYAEKGAAKQGCLLMKDTEVQARIREIQKELADQLMLTRERYLLELMEFKEICMAAKPVMEWSYEEHKMVHKGVYKIDAKGTAEALEMIGRCIGAFTEKKSNPDEGPVFISGEEDLKE